MLIDERAFEKALTAHCDDAGKQMIAWSKEVKGKQPEIVIPFILNPRSALQAAIEAYEAAKVAEQPVYKRQFPSPHVSAAIQKLVHKDEEQPVGMPDSDMSLIKTQEMALASLHHLQADGVLDREMLADTIRAMWKHLGTRPMRESLGLGELLKRVFAEGYECGSGIGHLHMIDECWQKSQAKASIPPLLPEADEQGRRGSEQPSNRPAHMEEHDAFD